MKWSKALAAIFAVALALFVWWQGERDVHALVAERDSELEKELASGNHAVSPEELLELMQNTGVRLELFDLRDENEYNLFHLQDARRLDPALLEKRRFVADLPREAIVVLISNGEGRARQGWKLLKVQKVPRLYILQGGIHGWLASFSPQRLSISAAACTFDDCRRYSFDAALGDRHPESAPDPKVLSGRQYRHKVKIEQARKRRAGSCG